MMQHAATAQLPWLILALDLLMVAAHLLAFWLLPQTTIELTNPAVLSSLLVIPSFVPLVAVGAYVAARRPENLFGWLLCGIGLGWQN